MNQVWQQDFVSWTAEEQRAWGRQFAAFYERVKADLAEAERAEMSRDGTQRVVVVGMGATKEGRSAMPTTNDQMRRAADRIIDALPLETSDDYADALRTIALAVGGIVTACQAPAADEGTAKIIDYLVRQTIFVMREGEGEKTEIQVPDRSKLPVAG